MSAVRSSVRAFGSLDGRELLGVAAVVVTLVAIAALVLVVVTVAELGVQLVRQVRAARRPGARRRRLRLPLYFNHRRR